MNDEQLCPTCGSTDNINCSNSYHLAEPEIQTGSNGYSEGDYEYKTGYQRLTHPYNCRRVV